MPQLKQKLVSKKYSISVSVSDKTEAEIVRLSKKLNMNRSELVTRAIELLKENSDGKK